MQAPPPPPPPPKPVGPTVKDVLAPNDASHRGDIPLTAAAQVIMVFCRRAFSFQAAGPAKALAVCDAK